MRARATRAGSAPAVALALLLGACGPGEGTDESVVEFCAAADDLADGTVLQGLDLTDLEGLSPQDPSLAAAVAAVDRLAEVPAPPDVAGPWHEVVAPLAAFLEALQDAVPSSATSTDDLRAAADALVEPEVGEAGTAVDAYVTEHC